MAISYTGKNKLNKIIEPLLSRCRAKYRGIRDSEMHNAEAMAIYMDISRISSTLDQVDVRINGDVERFSSSTAIYNTYSLDELKQIFLDDGVKNVVSGLKVYIDSDTKDYSDPNDQDDVYISTILRNQGRVSRILSRISTLEEGS